MSSMKQTQFIKSHAGILAEELPSPSEEWQLQDLNRGLSWSPEKLKHVKIIEMVAGRRAGSAATWRTREKAYNEIERLAENTGQPVPCHSTGVRNVGGEKPYTCMKDNCDKRYTREEVNWDAL